MKSGFFWARFGVIVAFLSILIGSGFMLTRVTPFEIQTLLPPEHPVRIEYENYLESFDDGRSAYVLLEKKSAPFSETEIQNLADEVEQYLKRSPLVADYTGPANAKYLVYEDGVRLRKFFEEGKLTKAGAEELERDLYRMTLINQDHSAFIVSFNVSQNFPRNREAPEIRKLDDFLAGFVLDHPEVEAHVLGTKIASAAFMNEMRFNIQVITPLLLLLIAIFMFWLYRSFQILIWNFAVMLLCYFSTLVVIILVEGGLGPYSNFALMFSFIVATTDLIHFFCRYQRTEGTVDERLIETRRICYVPCLLTSLCTSAGFSALILNQNLPIRYFGLYCAFACVFEWVVIFHVLPKVLEWFEFDAPVKMPKIDPALEVYKHWIVKFAKPIALSSIIVILAGSIGSNYLHVDDNFYEKFKANHSLSRAVRAFSERFQFVGSIDVLIDPKNGKITSEKNLAIMRGFEQELKKLPEVTKVSSYVTMEDELDHQLRAGKASQKKFKALKKSILLFLGDYGMFKDFYDESADRIRTVVFLRSFSTSDFESALGEIRKLSAGHENEIHIHVGGFSTVRDYINTTVIKDFLGSFFLSFFLTYLCFLYLYRNFFWAFLALLPNLLPLVTITGLMALFQVRVDSNLAILICVAFGISGDNTIHITYLIQKLKNESQTYVEKLGIVIHQIGLPVVATTGIFLFCLPVFLLGHLRLFVEMGVFLSVAFLASFYSDLFAFPAFHILFKKRK